MRNSIIWCFSYSEAQNYETLFSFNLSYNRFIQTGSILGFASNRTEQELFTFELLIIISLTCFTVLVISFNKLVFCCWMKIKFRNEKVKNLKIIYMSHWMKWQILLSWKLPSNISTNSSI